MNIILSLKNGTPKFQLENISYFYVLGELLFIMFENGKVRNYPLQNLWYYEIEQTPPHPSPKLTPEEWEGEILVDNGHLWIGNINDANTLADFEGQLVVMRIK